VSLEEQIEKAIVARFFEPTWIAQPQYVIDPQTGHGRSESVMMQQPAPMSLVSQAIYEKAKLDIVNAVLAKLDIDALVAEWAPIIAKDVIAQLQKTPDRWAAKPSKSERDKMLEKVYEAVAEEFGRQCVEHLKNTGGLMSVLEIT
jgi:hypothetical protein